MECPSTYRSRGDEPEELPFRGQLLLLLDQLGLFFIAQFDVVGAAGRAEVLAREGVQSIEITAALVGITERRSRTGEVLERRVTLDAILLAETFLLRAVNVADDDVVVVRERLAAEEFTESLTSLEGAGLGVS